MWVANLTRYLLVDKDEGERETERESKHGEARRRRRRGRRRGEERGGEVQRMRQLTGPIS